jgi:hypothetical protein
MEDKALWHPGLGPAKSPSGIPRSTTLHSYSPALIRMIILNRVSCKLAPKVAALENKARHKAHKIYFVKP